MASTIDAKSGFTIIGTRPARPDAVEKVTGRALFAADVHIPGSLYAKVLRSPHAHARIRSMNTKRAESLPGVRAIVTHLDFPPMPEELIARGPEALIIRDLRDNVLASGKALYEGHAIAAVAADDIYIAEAALDLIDVEYEVLPPVMTALEAMRPDAPALHENLAPFSNRARLEQVGSNALRIKLEIGSIEEALQQCDVVITREFTTETVHQAYIEPHFATVNTLPDGSMTVWTTCQSPYQYRDHISTILQIPQSKIRVIPTEVGGAFGGKEVAYLEPIAAMLSRKSGRPVRIGMTRAEDLMATGPTSGSYMKLTMGATTAGKILAADFHFAFEAGAFPGSPVVQAASVGLGRYDIPNQRAEGYDVVVNKPKTSHYRAPGATKAHFATEQVVDELAEQLGFDAIDFRMLNVVKEGDRNIQGIPYARIGGEEVLRAMKEHPHYSAPLVGPNRARGVAFGLWRGGGGISWCTLAVNADGTVSMLTGSPDMSGTRLTTAMQAAEVLGIPVESITSAVGDSNDGGFSSGTWASRTTHATGMAAYEAAKEVQRKMTERAAAIWNTDASSVEVVGPVFRSVSDASRRLTFKELAERMNSTGGPIVSHTVVEAPGGAGPAFNGHIVDVDVDPETGKVQILRCTAIQDAGTAVHPAFVEGQMQGGTVQGIGWALNEAYFYDTHGHMLNKSLLDYRLPVTVDVPHMETVIVEVPNPNHPYGVRPVGEVSISTPPAAIANAIRRALGVRMGVLPMSPGAVLEAIWQKSASKRAPGS